MDLIPFLLPIEVEGTTTSTGFIVPGGTSSGFLKANGTIDLSVYALDSEVLHNTGAQTLEDGSLTVTNTTTEDSINLNYLGVTFSRGANYLRPDATDTRTLYIGGGVQGSLDWSTVKVYTDGSDDFKWNDSVVLTQANLGASLDTENVAYTDDANNFSVGQIVGLASAPVTTQVEDIGLKIKGTYTNASSKTNYRVIAFEGTGHDSGSIYDQTGSESAKNWYLGMANGSTTAGYFNGARFIIVNSGEERYTISQAGDHDFKLGTGTFGNQVQATQFRALANETSTYYQSEYINFYSSTYEIQNQGTSVLTIDGSNNLDFGTGTATFGNDLTVTRASTDFKVYAATNQVTINSSWEFNDAGTLSFGSSTGRQGLLTWDSGYAALYGLNGAELRLGTSTTAPELVLDNAATFAVALSGTSADFSEGVTISEASSTTAAAYSLDVFGNSSVNNYVRFGRSTGEHLELNTQDLNGYFTFRQDENDSSDIKYVFDIASSTTGSKYFEFLKEVRGTSADFSGNLDALDIGGRTGNFSLGMNVGDGTNSSQLILKNSFDGLSRIYTTDVDGNASTIMQGGNYTYSLNLKDSYGTTPTFATIQGGYTNNAIIYLRRYDSDGNTEASLKIGTDNSRLLGHVEVSSSGASGLNLSVDTNDSSLSGRLAFSNGTQLQTMTMMNGGGLLGFYSGGTVGSTTGTRRAYVSSTLFRSEVPFQGTSASFSDDVRVNRPAFDPSSTTYSGIFLSNDSTVAVDQSTPGLWFGKSKGKTGITGWHQNTDEDRMGMNFWVHRTTTGTDPSVLGMSLSYSGELKVEDGDIWLSNGRRVYTEDNYAINLQAGTSVIQVFGDQYAAIPADAGHIKLSAGTIELNGVDVSTYSTSDTTYSQATSTTFGLVKIGYSENGKNYPVELSSGKMFVNVPWSDTNTDTNYYLNGITKSGNTLTFSVNGTTNQSYAFGSNAFNSTEFYKSGDNASFGTLGLTGALTGTSATFSGAVITGNLEVTGKSQSTSTFLKGGNESQAGTKFSYGFANSDADPNTYYKVCDITLPTGTYVALSMIVDFIDSSSNYGASSSIAKFEHKLTVVRSSGSQDDNISASIIGAVSNRIRLVRKSSSAWELQARSVSSYRKYVIEYQLMGGSASWITPAQSKIVGTTSGTIYTPTTTTQSNFSLFASGIQTNGLTLTPTANIYKDASLGFLTSAGGANVIKARSLLLSSSFADVTLVPDQGIYAAGPMTVAAGKATIQAGYETGWANTSLPATFNSIAEDSTNAHWVWSSRRADGSFRAGVQVRADTQGYMRIYSQDKSNYVGIVNGTISAVSGAFTSGIDVEGSSTLQGTTINATLNINTGSTPIKYIEAGSSVSGKYWRQVLDAGDMRWDVDTDNDGQFTPYVTPLKLFSDGTAELRGTNFLGVLTGTSASFSNDVYGGSNTAYGDDRSKIGSSHDTSWAASPTTAAFSHWKADSSSAHWLLADYDTSNNFRAGIQVLSTTNGTMRFYSTNSRGSYIEMKGGALTGTSASFSGSISEGGTSLSNKYQRLNTTNAAAMPIDATYYTSAQDGTGIMIKTPFTPTSSSAMVSFIVRAYMGYRSYDIRFSGYFYNSTNNWYEGKAELVAGDDPITARMGRDSDNKLYVWISGASYAGVQVFNVLGAYQPSNWNTGWSITRTNTTPDLVFDEVLTPPYSAFAGNANLSTVDWTANTLAATSSSSDEQLLRFDTERPWAFEQSGTAAQTSLRLRDLSGSKVFTISSLNKRNVALFNATEGNGTVFALYNPGVSGGSSVFNVGTNGDVTATGDVVAYSSSDKNLKDNYTTFNNPLEMVKKLSGGTFTWNDKQDTYTGDDVGVIAQEVEEVLPEIVKTRENGYKAVKYEKMVPLLIEANKALQDKVERLEAMVEQLINK